MIRNQEEINVWGPTSSGKTCLIKAFIKRIEQINDNSLDFNYHLQNFSETPIFHEVVEMGPTELPYSQGYVFRREPKEKYQNSPRHRLSSYEHHLIVYDDKGENTVKLAYDSKSFLLDAENLLLTLDPTNGKEEEGSSLTEESRDRYFNNLKKLFSHLASVPNKARNIAVCITKVDELPVKFRPPIFIVEMVFGNRVRNLLEFYSGKYNLELFSTSAVGFIDNNFSEANIKIQGISSNWDPQDANGDRGVQLEDVLKNTSKWIPYNVEMPFFWLFENIERNRLQSNNDYLGILKSFFVSDRIKKFIPYDIKYY